MSSGQQRRVRHHRSDAGWLGSGVTSLDRAAAMIRADLPRLSEAALARLLLEIRDLGPHPLGRLVEPAARAELRKRRPFMNH